MDDIIFVGLDVHKATVCVALAESGRGGEVRQVGAGVRSVVGTAARRGIDAYQAIHAVLRGGAVPQAG
ncbi:MAG: hypothetical protein ACREFO_02760 [Acetobacteraceae bacterium]